MKRVAAALLLLALTSGVQAAVEPEQALVATVNGVRIERWEAEREFQRLLPQTSFHGRVEGERRVELERQAVDALVMKELKRQWAVSQEVAVDGPAVDRELAEIRARFDDEMAYHSALGETGITEDRLRRAIVRDRLAADVDQRILSEVREPGPGDVRQFYESNRGEYVTPEARHVFHVLIHVPPSASTGIWDRAGTDAENVAQNVREGRTSLDDEAQRRRMDVPPRYRDQTGDLGLVHRGALQADVDEVVFTAQVGEVVGPIRTIFGFSVLEVKSIEPPRQMAFQQVRDAIDSRLKREWRAAALASFEENLHTTASIEWGQSSTEP